MALLIQPLTYRRRHRRRSQLPTHTPCRRASPLLPQLAFRTVVVHPDQYLIGSSVSRRSRMRLLERRVVSQIHLTVVIEVGGAAAGGRVGRRPAGLGSTRAGHVRCPLGEVVQVKVAVASSVLADGAATAARFGHAVNCDSVQVTRVLVIHGREKVFPK